MRCHCSPDKKRKYSRSQKPLTRDRYSLEAVKSAGFQNCQYPRGSSERTGIRCSCDLRRPSVVESTSANKPGAAQSWSGVRYTRMADAHLNVMVLMRGLTRPGRACRVGIVLKAIAHSVYWLIASHPGLPGHSSTWSRSSSRLSKPRAFKWQLIGYAQMTSAFPGRFAGRAVASSRCTSYSGFCSTSCRNPSAVASQP